MTELTVPEFFNKLVEDKVVVDGKVTVGLGQIIKMMKDSAFDWPSAVYSLADMLGKYEVEEAGMRPTYRDEDGPEVMAAVAKAVGPEWDVEKLLDMDT